MLTQCFQISCGVIDLYYKLYSKDHVTWAFKI